MRYSFTKLQFLAINPPETVRNYSQFTNSHRTHSLCGNYENSVKFPNETIRFELSIKLVYDLGKFEFSILPRKNTHLRIIIIISNEIYTGFFYFHSIYTCVTTNDPSLIYGTHTNFHHTDRAFSFSFFSLSFSRHKNTFVSDASSETENESFLPRRILYLSVRHIFCESSVCSI